MRVIAGVHRGRRLLGTHGHTLRPTSDRVKAALFSILGDRTQGARVLDLYAGTGAIGIEAMSRGAAHITFVEANHTACQILHEEFKPLPGASDLHVVHVAGRTIPPTCAVLEGSVRHRVCRSSYALTLDFMRSFDLLPHHGMTAQAVAIVEHGRKTALPSHVSTLLFHRRYEYGDTCLSLFHQDKKDLPSS